MSAPTVIVRIARGLLLAGLSFAMFVPAALARGDEPSTLKEATIRGLDGEPIALQAPEGGVTAIVLYSTECPISNAYSPTLKELDKRFHEKPVQWVGICMDPDLTDAEVRTHAKDFQLTFAVARDRLGTFARKIGATKTPEAFVIDDQGKIRYHGRIDDQYVARRVRNATPGTNELKDAIEAVLAGKKVARPYVKPVGCPIPEVPAGASNPTDSRDIVAIVPKNCLERHRKGQVVPFVLKTHALRPPCPRRSATS